MMPGNRIFFSAGLLVFIYVLAKAVTVNITHDEAYSFYNMKTFWVPEVLCTGNTHWLNSAAIKLAVWLKMEKEWQIRWLSILSAAGFLGATLLWMKEFLSVYLKFFVFSLLLLNPYILDYFSIARGYAPGLCCQALCLLFFYAGLKKESAKHRFLSLAFACLSALANFSNIYFLAAFSCVYFLKNYCRKNFFNEKSFYRDLALVAGVSALVARAFIYMTKCSNDVVGAGTDDFKEFTRVFTAGLLYNKLPFSVTLFNCLSVSAFALIVITVIYGLARAKKADPFYFYSALMLLLIMLMIFVNRYALGIVFPAFRSAIFLFPLTSLCLVLFADSSVKKEGLKKWVMTTLGVLLTVNFAAGINFKKVYDYPDSSDLKRALMALKERDAKFIGVAEEVYGSFRNYYIKTHVHGFDFSGDKLRTWRPGGVSGSRYSINRFDYLILFPPYDLSYYRNNTFTLRGITYFEETGTLLVSVSD